MTITRKRTQGAALVLAFAFILVCAAPAIAWGYLTWSDVSGLPGQGTSPHGGYATATRKCGVCHAVHGAAFGEILLPDTVANACNYCHVGGAGGYTQVYDGNPLNYSGTNLSNAHNSFDNGFGVEQGVQCTRCHQVHAADEAMTDNVYLTQRLLKGAKTQDFFDPKYDVIAGAPLSTDDYPTALTKWCAGCHFWLVSDVGGPHFADGYDMESHIMTTATATYSNPNASYSGQVAWKNSTYCTSCHASEFGVTPGAWPHFTDGDQFLVSAPTSVDATQATVNQSEDGVCLRCHRDGTGSGIGLNF